MHGLGSCTMNGMEIALAFIYTFLPILFLMVFIVCGAGLLDRLLKQINNKLKEKIKGDKQ